MNIFDRLFAGLCLIFAMVLACAFIGAVRVGLEHLASIAESLRQLVEILG